jgi:hypothetical protein
MPRSIASVRSARSFGAGTLTSRRRLLAASTAFALGATLLPATPAWAQGATAATASELGDSVKGVLQGASGGAFAYYQRSHPDGSPQRISLSYLPFDAQEGHRIGFAVYQHGTKLGGGTGQATGLGDPISSNAPSVVVTPSASGGPLLIQVFAYSPQIIIYTLSISAPNAPSGRPISGPLELHNSTAGVLPSNSGGADAIYQISQPAGSPLMLTLVYGPYDAGYAHRVGLTVYQAGSALGTATSLATGLGDALNRNAAQLTVTPRAGLPLTVQVFSYSRFDLTYSLLATS